MTLFFQATPKDKSRNRGSQNMQFTVVFFACLFTACGGLALMSRVYDRHRNRDLQSLPNRDSKYASNTIGHASLYQFFLGKSWSGWIIVLVTMAVQI